MKEDSRQNSDCRHNNTEKNGCNIRNSSQNMEAAQELTEVNNNEKTKKSSKKKEGKENNCK